MSVVVNHNHLPEIAELKRRLDILVTFEIIMMEKEDTWLRIPYKIFHPNKDIDIYRFDCNGDSMFIIFSKEGCIIHGFYQESLLSPYDEESDGVWPGILDEIPLSLRSRLDDPILQDDPASGFDQETVTFCIWREETDSVWRKGDIQLPEEVEDEEDDEDGFDYLMSYLPSSPEELVEFALGYHEKEIPLETIKKIWAGEKVTDEIIKEINLERDLEEAYREMENPCIRPKDLYKLTVKERREYAEKHLS